MSDYSSDPYDNDHQQSVFLTRLDDIDHRTKKSSRNGNKLDNQDEAIFLETERDEIPFTNSNQQQIVSLFISRIFLNIFLDSYLPRKINLPVSLIYSHLMNLKQILKIFIQIPNQIHRLKLDDLFPKFQFDHSKIPGSNDFLFATSFTHFISDKNHLHHRIKVLFISSLPTMNKLKHHHSKINVND
jgi:hypothetical protein